MVYYLTLLLCALIGWSHMMNVQWRRSGTRERLHHPRGKLGREDGREKKKRSQEAAGVGRPNYTSDRPGTGRTVRAGHRTVRKAGPEVDPKWYLFGPSDLQVGPSGMRPDRPGCTSDRPTRSMLPDLSAHSLGPSSPCTPSLPLGL